MGLYKTLRRYDMEQIVEVIYQNGVLAPLQPLGLRENQRLQITLRVPASRRKDAQGLSLASELLRIGRECAALPVLDSRTPEAILGYNEHGVPV